MSTGPPGLGECVSQVQDAGVDGKDALEAAGERRLEPVCELGALGAQRAREQVLEERGELGREAVVEARAGAQTPAGHAEQEAVPLGHRGVWGRQRGQHDAPDQRHDRDGASACDQAVLGGWAARRSMRSAGKRRVTTRANSLSSIRNVRV